MSLSIAAIPASHGLVSILIAGAVVLSVALTMQSAYTLYLMLYTCDQPKAYQKAQAPRRFRRPHISFTVMLPARHEEAVIQATIQRVVEARYPMSLLEVIVICSVDDISTTGRAREKVAALRAAGVSNVRVVTFDDGPINKPHGLNIGLRGTRNEVVTIFDAEDDIHPDIFNVVNTVMLNEGVRVVQCGVQLMDYQSRWYSTLNVLEYFFWFKSRLHYHARLGAMPLGGNTVFIARAALERTGGWDERNLTEDADIGMRLSGLGERMRVVYDDRYVTREETPPTLGQFIRQRTRWSQGFLQTLVKGDWRRLPTLEQRLLAVYTLAFPTAQAMLGVYAVLAVMMMLTIKAPVFAALLLDLPFYLLAAHLCLSLIGLYEFADAHGLKPSWKTPLLMVAGYLPYQWVLSYASLRATARYLQGANNWEKTQHVGAHRRPESTSSNPPHSAVA